MAALVGGIGWVAKMVVMAIQGGPDQQSVVEGIAFFAGLAGLVIAAAAFGAYLTREKATAWRVAAAFGTVVVVAAIVGLGQLVLRGLGDSWVQEEAIFPIVGLVMLVWAFRARSGSDEKALTSSSRGHAPA